jgi:nicotinamide mononucleotide (NMN) deamidase PncC
LLEQCQNIDFNTTLVTLNLKDHNGTLITAENGTGGYYSGGWYTIGNTGTNGQVSMELLPGSGYYFNMNFHNYIQQVQVNVTSGPTQAIDFQTNLVTLNLKDHNGNLITAENGTGGYYSGGWYNIGNTGTTGHVSMELLPGSGYYFNMNFHNYTQQMQVNVISGSTQDIDFQTTLVTLNLKDHTGNLITAESGTGGYYSGGWYT